jgi:hypothetical protein
MIKTCKPNGQVPVPATADELIAFLKTHVTSNLNYLQAAMGVVEEAYARNPAVRHAFANQDGAKHGVDSLVYSLGAAAKYAHQVEKARHWRVRRAGSVA